MMTTTMMGMMTTDPAVTSDPARPTRPGFSVRARITVVVALLVALSMSAVGAIIYALESNRIDSAAVAEADQEVAEFVALQKDGVDPETTKPFASVEVLLDLFLSRNVPGDNEMLIGWFDGRARLESSAQHRGLSRDPEIEEVVRGHLDDGGRSRIDSTAGEILVTVQPVRQRGSDDRGALVVITFLDGEHRTLNELMRTYLIVAVLSLGAITVLAAWQAGRLLAPLRRLNDTARDISVTDLSQRIPESGNDDITHLTRTVNQMLERLQTSFADQRQFLDAAGHELKTPLTVLRGHLELLDTGNPEDVAETQELLLDEVDRMARLVNDLILLAKTARPDFTVAEPVDLGSLTDVVLAKARGLGDRNWVDDDSGSGAVVLDEQRITQALLQLADNAVKHTGDGDTIAIGSTYDGTTVELWVRDTGAGVPPEDRELIFERFGRSHVPEGDEGFGLGLSIVKAIAEAHDGDVRVEDAEPNGARFVITLPQPGEEGPWHAS